MTLDQARIGQKLIVREVLANPCQPDWHGWLTDIGFVPGEPVELLHTGVMGKDPLLFRIGHSKFALRRAEAACIEVDLYA
jgi:ferrous iron transport protein A